MFLFVDLMFKGKKLLYDREAAIRWQRYICPSLVDISVQFFISLRTLLSLSIFLA